MSVYIYTHNLRLTLLRRNFCMLSFHAPWISQECSTHSLSLVVVARAWNYSLCVYTLCAKFNQVCIEWLAVLVNFKRRTS